MTTYRTEQKKTKRTDRSIFCWYACKQTCMHACVRPLLVPRIISRPDFGKRREKNISQDMALRVHTYVLHSTQDTYRHKQSYDDAVAILAVCVLCLWPRKTLTVLSKRHTNREQKKTHTHKHAHIHRTAELLANQTTININTSKLKTPPCISSSILARRKPLGGGGSRKKGSYALHSSVMKEADSRFRLRSTATLAFSLATNGL